MAQRSSLPAVTRRSPVAQILRRGLRRKCPRCGEGPLFRRGIEAFERCSECQLRLQPDQGDTWMFMIITDRIPILFGIVAIYFGFQSTSWPVMVAFFAALAVPVIVTMPHRQGLALAIDYLARVHAGDLTHPGIGTTPHEPLRGA